VQAAKTDVADSRNSSNIKYNAMMTEK